MPAKIKQSASNPKPSSVDRFEWDSEVPGLALRRRPDRKPAWYVQIWTDGRNVRRSIGPETALTLEQARDMARALISELTGETNPLPLVPDIPKATVRASGNYPAINRPDTRPYQTKACRNVKKPLQRRNHPHKT